MHLPWERSGPYGIEPVLAFGDRGDKPRQNRTPKWAENRIAWYWDYCCSLRLSFTHDRPFGPASPIQPGLSVGLLTRHSLLCPHHDKGTLQPSLSHAGLPWLCSYSLRPYPHLELPQLSLQLCVFLFMPWDQSHISIRTGCPGHIITTDTVFHPQLSAFFLQLPMTNIYLSLSWQTSHFLWFLIYKTKLEYFSIFPHLGLTSFIVLIFRPQWWQGVKDFHTVNAVWVKWSEK